MTPPVVKTETRYLMYSALGNLLLGVIGGTIACLSSSQAILLDGLFNLTYFGAGLFAVRVANLVASGDDERFPHGYSSFEPLINGVKGALVLGVSVMALLGAVQALLDGGREVSAGLASGYGVFATIACGIVAFATDKGGKATGSPLLLADAKNWLVNAAVSFCVLLAFAGIFLLQLVGLDRYTPYVDPLVVVTVVTISLGVPVRMSWDALMALLNRAPSQEVVTRVEQIVDESLAGLPIQERFIRVVQPGRQRMVLIHVVLPDDFGPRELSEFDAIRQRTFEALRERHVATLVDILFTADRQWGAPLSDGGSVG